jgi:hypothetical protein
VKLQSGDINYSRYLIAIPSFTLIFVFIDKLLNGRLLNVKDSDFLTAFPNYELSQLFGRKDLYQGSLAEQWMGSEFWQYGPMHQFFSIPLYLLPSITSVMTFLFFILFFVYFFTIRAYLINSSITFSNKQNKLGLILTLSFFYPFLSAINQRNFELIELLLIVQAAVFYKKSNYLLAGVLIGLATGVKFLPIIIFGFFILERNRKAIYGFLLSIIPQVIVTQLIFDWSRSFTFRLVSEGEPETIPLRQGLADVILRLQGNSGGNYNIVYFLIVSVICLITLYLTLRFLRIQRNHYERWRIWCYLLGIVCLIVPHSNNYYFVFFVPLLIEVYATIQNRRFSLDALLFGIGVFLISLPLPFAILWRLLPESSSEEIQQLLVVVQNSSPMFFGGAVILILALKNSQQILRLPTKLISKSV